jgi:hypothetical protein
MTSRSKRACPLKQRRTRNEMAALRQAIADVVAEDPPMTVRQFFSSLSPAA